MPTIRQLASDLKLAKGTVAKAYALLEELEVLETLGRKGSFILNPTKNASGSCSNPPQLSRRRLS